MFSFLYFATQSKTDRSSSLLPLRQLLVVATATIFAVQVFWLQSVIDTRGSEHVARFRAVKIADQPFHVVHLALKGMTCAPHIGVRLAMAVVHLKDALSITPKQLAVTFLVELTSCGRR